MEPPQVTFSVKQKRPKTLDEAVVATIEMESYLPQAAQTTIAVCEEEDEKATVAPVSDATSSLAGLVEQVENLEQATEWNQSSERWDKLLDELIPDGNHEVLGELVGIWDNRDISPGGAPRPGRYFARETSHLQR